MKTIVLTTDFSEESRRAYAPALSLAKKLGANICLLHVVPEMPVIPHGSPLAPPITEPDLGSELEHARHQLDELRAELSGQGVEVGSELRTGSDVVASIVGYAQEVDAGLIALSMHGRTGLRHLILGSIAEQVLRHAKTPVICYPPAE